MSTSPDTARRERGAAGNNGLGYPSGALLWMLYFCYTTSAALLLLLVGLLIEAAYQALQARHLSPIIGYFVGLWDGLRWPVARE